MSFERILEFIPKPDEFLINLATDIQHLLATDKKGRKANFFARSKQYLGMYAFSQSTARLTSDLKV